MRGLAAAESFTPELSNFSLDLGPYYDMLQMDQFWLTHPHIRSLEVLIYHTLTLPEGSLPELHRISVVHAQQTAIVRGRPVTDIAIRQLSDEQCTLFMHNLRASTAHIQRLEVRFAESSTTAYSEVLSHLRHLRFLRITQESMPDKGENHVVAMEGLASLRDLETIEWGGLRGPDERAQQHFFAACSKYCPALRRVTFHWWGGSGRTLQRSSPDGEWVAVAYNDKGT